MRSFIREIYQSFIKIHGYPIIFIGLLISIISFTVSPNSLIYFKWILPLVVFLIIIILTFLDLSWRLYYKASNPLPVVRQVRKPPIISDNSIALLILEPSDLYSHESLVSIFHSDEEYEKLIGLGYVLTIQNNGMIQVMVNRLMEDSDQEIIKRALNNDVLVLKKILVKPTIPKGLWGG